MHIVESILCTRMHVNKSFSYKKRIETDVYILFDNSLIYLPDANVTVYTGNKCDCQSENESSDMKTS